MCGRQVCNDGYINSILLEHCQSNVYNNNNNNHNDHKLQRIDALSLVFQLTYVYVCVCVYIYIYNILVLKLQLTSNLMAVL